jgi:CsoR family transcriptional regulator, copper-sensing transcriptional repressor
VDQTNPNRKKTHDHNQENPEDSVNINECNEDSETNEILDSFETSIPACHVNSSRNSHHSDKTKQNLITRLNRVEGQIRGIKGLIERDTYCDDVITQIAATNAALNSVAKILLEGHLKSCVVERIQSGDDEVIDELLTTIQRLMKK